MSIKKQAPFPIPYGYSAGRETFPSYIDNRHLCTVGPTRAGKGASVIIQALLRMTHSMVVVDPKGQNAAVTARHRRAMGQDVFVLNPFGLHTGGLWHLPRHRYNPLSRLRINDPNVTAEAAALSQALIVTQGRDPYFDDTARDLVTAIILYLVSTLGRRATLAQVRRAITDIAARGKDSAMLLRAIAASPHPLHPPAHRTVYGLRSPGHLGARSTPPSRKRRFWMTRPLSTLRGAGR